MQFQVSGTIRDEKNNPVPYAKVYIKNSTDLRFQANSNGEYTMRLMPGEYFLITQALGYEEKETIVMLIDKDVQKDIQLLTYNVLQISDVEASAKKSNPGREIMLKVIEKREKINPWNYPHSCKVYTKAFEKIGDKKNKEEKKGKEQKIEKKEKKSTSNKKDIEDPFLEEKNKILAENNKMNLVEVQIDRHFMPYNKVKEVRNAYTKRGEDKDLYYLTTVKSNFNFFENLLHLTDLHQSPVSSPISSPGILSYKYRLEKQYIENGKKIHKIKIIARNTSTSTLTGYIYVIDSIWMIQKLELSLEKGNLLKYDQFNIFQEYEIRGDSLNVLSKQNLTYNLSFGNNLAHCKTETVFSDYEFNKNFPAKFFTNELASTEKEAYEKDSIYWKKQRALELSEEEKKYIRIKDSIHERLNRKDYLDSIDKVFNKLTFWKIVWFGVDHRNREKRTQWTINSIAATARPLQVTGPQIAPGFSYFKKWKNERFIDMYDEISYGIIDKNMFTQHWFRYRYSPFHYGTLNASFRHGFDVIRSYDAISQIFNPNNFIGVTTLNLGHDYELINGLFFDAQFSFSERRSLDGYQFFGLYDSTQLKNYFTDFPTYQAMIGNFTLSYTPAQKYMKEPYRKVILGSKWPTIYLLYEKGIPSIFGSDINFDYLLFGFYQSFQVGTIGTSNYHIKSGKFLNTSRLYDADFKYHRRSDPIWFSNPLHSFQQLEVSLPSREIFYEAHLVHHDNGAIINKIPLMKKINIGLVFGGGALYVEEFSWFHSEILGGLERNFKFSKRRLRIGIYGIMSYGNNIKPSTTWKVSFSVLDDRNMKWNF
ncbi:MAG: carboxypeptidase regulatory-like domain-containing protein [Flavobacteriia bacterium]|nr:carboxypeptidase regulatory-like domain-containing protein [Flavobacteriia bacterium]